MHVCAIKIFMICMPPVINIFMHAPYKYSRMRNNLIDLSMPLGRGDYPPRISPCQFKHIFWCLCKKRSFSSAFYITAIDPGF